MKKYILCFSIISAANVHIQAIYLPTPTSDQTDYDQRTPILSSDQLFLLNDIEEQLNMYAPIMVSQWTSNENIQIFIERIELAVQQAPTQTQLFLKDLIIKLFQQFGINISFTPANSIILAMHMLENNHKQTHLYPKKTKTKQPQSKIFDKNLIVDKPTQPKALPRIHGARRTMNRLKKEREKQRAKELEQQKLDILLKKTKPSDPNLSQDIEFKRDIFPPNLSEMEFFKNKPEQQTSQQQQDLSQDDN